EPCPHPAHRAQFRDGFSNATHSESNASLAVDTGYVVLLEPKLCLESPLPTGRHVMSGMRLSCSLHQLILRNGYLNGFRRTLNGSRIPPWTGLGQFNS